MSVLFVSFYIYSVKMLLQRWPVYVMQPKVIGVHSTVVEQAPHMWMYALLSPTGVDHHEKLREALSCSQSDAK